MFSDRFDNLKNTPMGHDIAVFHNNRANAFAASGRYQEALENYAKAIEFDPEFSRAYYNRGVTYYEMQRYDEALDDYDAAILFQPNYAAAYYNRGITYRQLERFEDAIRDFDQVLKMAYDSPADAYYSRGKTYAQLQQYQQALNDLDQAIRLNPKLVFGYVERALLFDTLGHYEKAEEDLKRAIDLDPNYGLAYINMAISLRHMGRLREALPYLKKATKTRDRELAAEAREMILEIERLLAQQSPGGSQSFISRLFGGRAKTKKNRSKFPSRDSGDKALRTLGSREVPPGLRAFSEELRHWPPEKRRILENILAEAIDAGVTSWPELSAFLDSRPDLRAEQSKVFFSGNR